MVSVVVPAYNAQDYIAGAIESVVRQTWTAWELIVVDDGSTDNTGEIARGYAASDKRIRCLWQENGNQARARNYGYRAASRESRYFLFLDADDVLDPAAIATLLDSFKQNPHAMAVFGQADYIDADGNRLDLVEHPSSPAGRWTYLHGKPSVTSWSSTKGLPPTFHSFAYGCSICTPGAVLIARSSLERTGLFDPDLPGVEDWDLWTRMSLAGPIAFTDRTVVHYRVHAQGVSRNAPLMRMRALLMRKKLLESGLPPEPRRQAIEAFQFQDRRSYRVPAVEGACAALERALGIEGGASAGISGQGLDSEQSLRRDIYVLIALDCDVGIASKVLRTNDESPAAILAAEEIPIVRRAARQIAAERKILHRWEALRALSLRWPLLPFRKAFRLLRHVYRWVRERGFAPTAPS